MCQKEFAGNRAHVGMSSRVLLVIASCSARTVADLGWLHGFEPIGLGHLGALSLLS
jgi:hypothetical protein